MNYMNYVFITLHGVCICIAVILSHEYVDRVPKAALWFVILINIVALVVNIMCATKDKK